MSQMMWDKSKSLQTIMKKRMAGGGEVVSGPTPMNEESVKNADGSMDLKHLAAQDVMDAFHTKSADKLRHSLGNFLDLHLNEKQSESETDPKE